MTVIPEARAILLGFLFAFLALLVFWTLYTWKKLSMFARLGIPGPKTKLFLGNMLELMNLNDNSTIELTGKWIDEFGSVLGYYIGCTPYLVVSDPEIVRRILVTDFQYFTDRPPLFVEIPPLSGSFTHSKGQMWKTRRSVISPAFSQAKLKTAVPRLNKCVETLVSKFEATLEKQNGEINPQPLAVHDLYQRCVMDVTAASLFGIDSCCQRESSNIFLEATRSFFGGIANPIVYLLLVFPPIAFIFGFLYRFTYAGKLTMKAIENLEYTFKQANKNLSQKRGNFWEAIRGRNSKGALEVGQSLMNDDEVALNAFLLMIASYETTAKTMAYVTFVLSKYPEYQDKIYEEISTILGEDEDNYPQISELEKLTFLDQVMSETLRMYPPFSNFVNRKCMKDIEINGVMIKKGVNVEIPVWRIHHDKELWKEPWTFDPERFNKQNKLKHHPMAFLPFGAGPRMCVGPRFALLEIKMVLVCLLRKFRFEFSSKGSECGVELPLISEWGLIKPKNEVYVHLKRRTS